MCVVAWTPILVMVSSAHPVKSFGNSRVGSPSSQTRALAARCRLWRMRTCIKRGSPGLNWIGFDRSMIRMRSLLHDPVRQRADAVDGQRNGVAPRQEAAVLDAAAAGERTGPEQLAGVELLTRAGVRKDLTQRPACIARRTRRHQPAV